MTAPKPLVLLVLDGWGLRRERQHNAIALARKPAYNELIERFPHTTLVASGERVGLPTGQMGNSEVGHMNMGAGRVVYQDLTRIDKSIEDGDFFLNLALTAALDRCASGQHALHVIGLVSDGGVHSHQRHLHTLIEMAARRRVSRLFVHVFTDGRDTSPTSGIRYVATLSDAMARTGVGRVASISGRYYAMDRDKRWDRTERAFNVLVSGANGMHADATAILQQSYESQITDEFVNPTTLHDREGRPVATIQDGDSVVCFNFRADRVRQITRAIAFSEFDGFDRRLAPRVHYTCMTEYDATFQLPVAFTLQTFGNHLGEVLGAIGISNLRLAETEKYAHVTYFFNCGEERPYRGEDRILIPSPKVPTYDLKPEMSARGIADALVDDISNRRHDVVICNFANADMVGHTGKLDAAIAAVEVVDECLGRIVGALRSAGGIAVVTADHGNCEQMWDEELASPHTAHTSNPVPLIVVGDSEKAPLREGGALCDVAPTILGLLGVAAPHEMSGRDLRRR